MENNTRARLTRKQLAEFLTASGYPISYSVLNKLCMPSNGQGPPVDVWWGARALYHPDTGLAWAESRLRRPNTSQAAA
jgi:hypothetical protein